MVRWLQVGAVAAGMGIALAASPAIASADDATNSVTSDSAKPAATHRGAATGRHSAAPAASASGRSSGVRAGAAAAVPTSTGPVRAVSTLRRSATTIAVGTANAAGTASTPVASTRVASTTAKTTSAAVSADPLGNIAAFLGLPGAPATSAPALDALPLLLRLTLEDVFTGTGPAPVTNPTGVITGLFNQVLRENPTTDELQNYLGVLALTGVNGVVAGLYSSTQFRQQEIANYYLEMLSRPATQDEISWGASRLMWGTPEPLVIGSIASTREFYAASASGGGQYGPTPTANSFVNLLYRTLLGQGADPTDAAIYVQRLQAGLPSGFVAMDFVTSDPFRTVKVGEIFSVLGQAPTDQQVAGYVANWLLNGGLAGIATSLMATSSNVQNIEAGRVVLPDTAAAAKLQTLLLSPYTENADGFYAQFGTLLSLNGVPISRTNPCTPSNANCDQALFELLTTGGSDRGLPNSALSLKAVTASVATLIPTQKEIDISKSLKYPLQHPDQLEADFQGGLINPFTDILTANNGTYIIDGHHRWSGVVLINPYTQISAVDLGYVPTPQDGLKQAQVGVAAVNDFLPSSTVVPGLNLYDMSQDRFNEEVNNYILNAAEAHTDEPTPTTSWTDQILNVFTDRLALQGLTDPEKYQAIDNYLWNNVLRMRELNPFVPGATSRTIMPQTDPLSITETYFASGALSYTFPTISYLG